MTEQPLTAGSARRLKTIEECRAETAEAYRRHRKVIDAALDAAVATPLGSRWIRRDWLHPDFRGAWKVIHAGRMCVVLERELDQRHKEMPSTGWPGRWRRLP